VPFCGSLFAFFRKARDKYKIKWNSKILALFLTLNFCRDFRTRGRGHYLWMRE